MATPGVVLHTARTTLRPWRDEDREPFAAMCADPVVMEFFPSVMTRDECDAFVQRRVDEFGDHGWGLWALDVDGRGFAGFVGLTPVGFDAPFTPAIEIGWRLARAFWNDGLATEAALAALDYGFTVAALPEVVSITSALNVRSQRVMQKIGMTRRVEDDFDHPRVPEGHPLRPHVLYRTRSPLAS